MSTAAPPTAAPHHHHHAPSPTSPSISASLTALSRLAPRLAPSSPTSPEPPLETFFCALFPGFCAALTFALLRDIALGVALKPLAREAAAGDVTRRGVQAVVEVVSALSEQQQGSREGEGLREDEDEGEGLREDEDEVARWLERFVGVVKREVVRAQGDLDRDMPARQESSSGNPSPPTFKRQPPAKRRKTRPAPSPPADLTQWRLVNSVNSAAPSARPAPDASSAYFTSAAPRPRTPVGIHSPANADATRPSSVTSPRPTSSSPLHLGPARTSCSAAAAATAANDGDLDRDRLDESPPPIARRLPQQLADAGERATASGRSAAAATASREPPRDKDRAAGTSSAHDQRDAAQPAKRKARVRSPSRSRSSSPTRSPRRAALSHPPKHTLPSLGAVEASVSAAASSSRSAKAKAKPKPTAQVGATSIKAHQAKKSPYLPFPGDKASPDERERDTLGPAPAPARAPAPTLALGEKQREPRGRPRVETPDDVDVDAAEAKPKPKPKAPPALPARPTVERQQTLRAEEDEGKAPAASRRGNPAAPLRRVGHLLSSSDDDQGETGPSRSRRRTSLSPPPPPSSRSKPRRKGNAAAPRTISIDDDGGDVIPSVAKGKSKGREGATAAAAAVASKRRTASTVTEETQPPRASSSSSAPLAKKGKGTSSSRSGAKAKTPSTAAPRSSTVIPRVEGSRSSARVAAAGASSGDDDDEKEDSFRIGERVYSWHDGILVWPSVIVSRLAGGQIAWATLPGTKPPAKVQIYFTPLAIARAKLARAPHGVLLSAPQRRDIDAANALYDDERALQRWLAVATAAVDEEKDKRGLETEEEEEEQ